VQEPQSWETRADCSGACPSVFPGTQQLSTTSTARCPCDPTHRTHEAARGPPWPAPRLKAIVSRRIPARRIMVEDDTRYASGETRHDFPVSDRANELPEGPPTCSLRLLPNCYRISAISRHLMSPAVHSARGSRSTVSSRWASEYVFAQRLRGPAPNTVTSNSDGFQDRRLKPLGHPSALMRKRLAGLASRM